MKRHILIAGLACTLAVGAVDSSNAHGILRIDSTATNTLIAIPWRGYSEFGDAGIDLMAEKLVKPRNLVVGDELLLLDAVDSQTFASWTLQDIQKDGVVRAWVAGTTVRRRDDGSSYVYSADAELPARRGYGLWLVRQRPVDVNGKAIPFYLHGQWTRGPEEVTVVGVSDAMRGIRGYDATGYTMLANPDCTRETDVNRDLEWDWSAVGTNDTLVISSDRASAQYCFRREIKRGEARGTFTPRWYRADAGGTTGVLTTSYTDEIKVPAGTGFWYVRRSPGDFKLRWKAP